MTGERTEVELSAGRLRYRDVGSGPPLVFVHGLFVNGDLWRHVAADLSDGFRCVVPDLPLGAHRVPMAADADLSPPGIARLLVEFVDALGVPDATVVGNDTGGAFCQLLVSEHPDRVGRLVLTNCDAFDNFLPPRYRYLQHVARLPGSMALLARLMQFRAVRRSPIAFGPLTESGIPEEIEAGYARPLREDPGVRRDARKVLTGISPGYTNAAAERFPEFERPVLLAWGVEDDVAFPTSDARRLCGLFPDCRLVEIEGATAFVPEDRPERLAAAIREFVGESGGDDRG